MSAIAGEHRETAPASLLTRARLKWLAYATLGAVIAFVGARYGYEYWTVGRFIESTDDAYAGAMSPRYRRTLPASWRKSSLATTNTSAQDSR